MNRSRSRSLRHLLLGLSALVTAWSPLRAEVQAGYPFETLVIVGDTVPGVGTVTTIEDFAVNDSGDWAVIAKTDAADPATDRVLLRNGSPYIREGDVIQGRIIQFVENVSLNPSGELAWLALTNRGRCVYVDLQAAACQGDYLLPLQNCGGGAGVCTIWDRIWGLSQNAAGQLGVVADLVTEGISVVRVRPGSTDYESTIIVSDNDFLPGQTERVYWITTQPWEPVIDSHGRILYRPLIGSNYALYRDLELLLQDGGPSPIPGRNYESLGGAIYDTNSGDDLALIVSLDGDPTDDLVLLVNSDVLAREGDVDITPGNYALTGFAGPIRLDDQRNLLWWGTWADPDVTRDEALLLNDVLLVRKGTTVIESSTVIRIEFGLDIGFNRLGFTASEAGRYVVFEAGLADGREGAFRIDVAPPVVADGGSVGGTAMTADRHPGSDGIEITWDTSCGAPQYNLFYGPLDTLASMSYDGEVCELGASGQTTFFPPAGNIFWIIAGADPATGIEGAHGFDSRGLSRPISAEGRCGVVAQIRSAVCRP